MILKHLGKPLTQVPDPFGEYDSFAAHNNARLQRFLDHFGFEYEFASSTDYYKAGRFDAALLHMLARFEAVQKIMLPTLREERAATYSPFLPIHPRTGIVMQVPLVGHDAAGGDDRWRDPDTGEMFETPVTGGHCKLQWKPDWAMRWYALNVDYEMAGKDLIDSVKLSSAIVRALGGDAAGGLQLRALPRREGPEDLQVEGQRPDHRRMADLRQPGKPVAVHVPEADRRPSGSTSTSSRARSTNISAFSTPIRARNGRSGSAIRSGTSMPARRRRPSGWPMASRPRRRSPSACCSISPPSPTARIRRCCGASCAATRPPCRRRPIRGSTRLVGYAVAYFRDFVAPKKRYRAADEVERAALAAALGAAGRRCRPTRAPKTIQHALYDVARPIPRYQDLKAKGATPERPGVSNDWFNMIYHVLLGEERGPRLGSFIALYGIEETRALIAKALAGELAAA